jgi:hypothetical protein
MDAFFGILVLGSERPFRFGGVILFFIFVL